MELETCLRVNTDIAARYRQLQNEFVSLKNKHLDKLDARVQVEKAIADLKKVSPHKTVVVLNKNYVVWSLLC